jgi:hypothetical protein
MIFFWQAKKRAIKKFATQLPKELESEYGKKHKYTPEEIEAVFKRYHYHKERKYWCYGFAMHSGRPEFDAYHLSRGESCDFNTMRNEVLDIVLATGVLGGGIAGEIAGSESSGFSDGGGVDAGGSD